MVLVDLVTLLDARSNEGRDASLTVIGFPRRRSALATTTWQVDDELWARKAGNSSTDLRFELENGGQWRTQVLNALDHVSLVDIVRINVVVGELVNESVHGLSVIVDAFEENALVANTDALLVELESSLFGDPGNLIWVVEMGVHSDRLEASVPLWEFSYLTNLVLESGVVGYLNQSISPSIIRV